MDKGLSVVRLDDFEEIEQDDNGKQAKRASSASFQFIKCSIVPSYCLVTVRYCRIISLGKGLTGICCLPPVALSTS